METFNFRKSRIFWMIMVAIAFNWALHHLGAIWSALMFILRIILPVIIGIALAFIIGVFVDLIEDKILPYKPERTHYNKLRRIISVSTSVIIVIGSLAIISIVIIPRIIESLQSLGKQMPYFAQRIQQFIDQLVGRYPQFGEWVNLEELDSQAITQYVSNLFTNQLPKALGSLVSVTNSVFNVLFNLLLGIILAIYFLLQRERIVKGFHQIVYAFTNKEFTRRTTKLFHLTDMAIKNFVTGQMIEAINVGILTYLGMIIFSIPSALLVSFIVGLTAMIPLFGSLIGVGLGFLIVAIANFSKAFWFLLIVIVVIQLDNYLLYPRVVGNKTGTPPIIILLAVTLFGNLFGLVGMIIGVPIAAIVYSLITEATRSRIKKKLRAEELKTVPVRSTRV